MVWCKKKPQISGGRGVLPFKSGCKPSLVPKGGYYRGDQSIQQASHSHLRTVPANVVSHTAASLAFQQFGHPRLGLSRAGHTRELDFLLLSYE